MSDMGWTEHVSQQEEANLAGCLTTAARYGVKAEQAEHCDSGCIGCPDCPFRDPRRDPIAGDRLRLSDGTRIEVYVVRSEHTVRPEVEYEKLDWRRGWGGRKRYCGPLKDWPLRVANAEVLRRGPLIFGRRGVVYGAQKHVDQVRRNALEAAG